MTFALIFHCQSLDQISRLDKTTCRLWQSSSDVKEVFSGYLVNSFKSSAYNLVKTPLAVILKISYKCCVCVSLVFFQCPSSVPAQSGRNQRCVEGFGVIYLLCFPIGRSLTCFLLVCDRFVCRIGRYLFSCVY